MLKKIVFHALVAVCLISITACEKNAPEPALAEKKMAKVTTAYSNEFTLTGDGSTAERVEIDTAIKATPRSSYAHSYVDSIQISVVGQAVVNGVTRDVELTIYSRYSGPGTYAFGPGDNTYIGISYIENVGGSFSFVKEYNSVSGSMTIDKADANGFIAGSYSGDFVIDHNPAKPITITDGKFITRLY